MRKMRLLLHSDCNRDCPGCCNKQWDPDALPTFKTFNGFDEVILTGGEPILHPDLLFAVILEARKTSDPGTKIYLYTADVTNKAGVLIWITRHLDGICLTLHEQEDVGAFLKLQRAIDAEPGLQDKSFRLNIFKGIEVPEILPF
jgi:organic radical activating enzyme